METLVAVFQKEGEEEEEEEEATRSVFYAQQTAVSIKTIGAACNFHV